jgi:hypothetical protein
MRHVLLFILAACALGCHSSDPIERVRRNVADREKIQAEGTKLQQQNLCTPDAIAVADDPDRHFLACAGFATADGPNPGILAFREQHHGSDDQALFAACYDRKSVHTNAVGVVLCRPAVERLRVLARQRRDAFAREGHCTNQALRTSEEPDRDYFTCYGHQLYFEEHIRLAEFKQRFGPGLDTIRQRCPQIRDEIKKADEARMKALRNAQEPASETADVLGLAGAHGVFCTEEPPRGVL